jgi:hypothetical protein
MFRDVGGAPYRPTNWCFSAISKPGGRLSRRVGGVPLARWCFSARPLTRRTEITVLDDSTRCSQRLHRCPAGRETAPADGASAAVRAGPRSSRRYQLPWLRSAANRGHLLPIARPLLGSSQPHRRYTPLVLPVLLMSSWTSARSPTPRPPLREGSGMIRTRRRAAQSAPVVMGLCSGTHDSAAALICEGRSTLPCAANASPGVGLKDLRRGADEQR